MEVDEGNGTSHNGFSPAIERIAPAVVVLRVCNVRAFDGDGRGCSSATGFVVDKERGIILTNRHVVSPGPVMADAMFLNKEEVQVEQFYADPVHDFGFFKFNPKDVKFMDLVEIPLSPERAKVGLEIRVIGNDAGEKLSILSGTLARLDRDAPHYGSKEYNDHNTFYYAAASSTSGGSSGSPVIDCDGHAVALNAGGKTKSASSFYLPLNRIVRALRYIQEGTTVPRRTIQTIFKHIAFTEARRLGLAEEDERQVRETFPGSTGLLAVDQVVPEGPGNRADLQPGDILLKLNRNTIHEFEPLADAMDDNPNVHMVLRRGSEVFERTIETDDLHELTPNEYLEVSGGIIHPLSYQQAINSAMKPGSVFVASSGFMLGRADINWNSIIVAVGDEATPDMASFEQAICKYPELSNVSIRFVELKDKFCEQIRSCTVDRTWFVWRKARRGADRSWHYVDLPGPERPLDSKVHRLTLTDSVCPSLVMVAFDVPFQVDGIPIASFFGTGVVVDASLGLVVCDRNTIPNALGNATVTFAGSVELPARVILVHPMHNFSVVQYDPSRIVIEANGKACSLDSSESPNELVIGSETTFIGLSHQMNQVKQKCAVANIERLLFLLTSPPRFTARNQVVIHVDNIVSNVGGLFVDEENRIQAFWFSFSYQSEGYKDKETFAGVPAQVVFETIRNLKRNYDGERFIHTLGTDFVVTPVSKARSGMGLSEEWVNKFTGKYNQVLTIRNVHVGSMSAGLLRASDLLLAVDGEPMTDFNSVDRAVADKDSVEVTIIRDLAEQTVPVPISLFSCSGTSRLVLFGGMFLQAPHLAVGFRGYLPKQFDGHEGVYCSRWFYGSPAHRYGLKATHFIIGIDDKEITDLNSLLEIVREIKNGQFVRVQTISLKDKRNVFALRTDFKYWPTVDLMRNPQTNYWSLQTISSEY